MDMVLDFMKKNNIPLTRDNYLYLQFMGDVPEELGELEAEIPDEIIEAEEEIKKLQLEQLSRLKREDSRYTN